MRSLHFAWRGWILGGLLAVVAMARWNSAEPLRPVWLVLMAAGLAWRWLAGMHIAGHSNGLALAGPVMAARGPYRFGRHPLYLSNFAVIAGLVLFANCLPWWGAGLCLAAAAAHHEILARTEEAFLAVAGGEAYRRYMRVTPRWLGWRRAATAEPGAASSMRESPATRAAVATETDSATAAAAWRRQGPNIAKACACAAFLWLLAVRAR